ncbi:hypothetical protein EV385_3007 [Krasilnikovia cinnamomea]|uniref:Uncharacterized protein n=1 Tax=Krasilnikovia cinnamomea TaxID=349313 RepID=A0A4Q7ZLT3_9ACTN|nr:hypothetical protein [Krasilnikovia cinnamomea]RZU51199.1 hypothetical protein EV385_3007 [Krasilnikovia cinnamomea]
MIDATRGLREKLGMGLVVLAICSTLMTAGLAADRDAPGWAATAAFIGTPLNLVGLVFVVRSVRAKDASRSSRFLAVAAAFVLVAVVVLILGARSTTA